MGLTEAVRNSDDALTTLDIIRRTTEYFKRHNVDSPRLTTELMLCEILKCNRVGLYMHYDKPLENNELEYLRDMLRRRVRREPLQYILGSTEFFGLYFKVSPDVLIPRPETELLVEQAKKYIKNSGKSSPIILDIGTGSGCIAIALANAFAQSSVTAIDISESALVIANENGRLNGTSNVRFLQGDIFDNNISLNLTEKYDVIVSNPPYIQENDIAGLQPEVGHFEPLIALTDKGDGLTFYRRFAEIFRFLLNENGCFFIEIGYEQADSVCEIFSVTDFETAVSNDYAGIPRIISGHASIQTNCQNRQT
ncbi:hypothetical protein MASR2M18_11930 [Ignavibacteria bacterium]|nr:peptide chain release factor N(5)-glutamine methyltransferase [Bacteroidota bacterium]MCZ2133259.1 peptide chain release factor N(5)-glutamine methyltransferase [Bacteroidota bacterium]